jgi:hypothetical protein
MYLRNAMPNPHQQVKAIYGSLPAISALSLCSLFSIVFGSIYLARKAKSEFPHGRTSCYFKSVTIKPKNLETTYLVQLLDLCSMHDHNITVLQEQRERTNSIRSDESRGNRRWLDAETHLPHHPHHPRRCQQRHHAPKTPVSPDRARLEGLGTT